MNEVEAMAFLLEKGFGFDQYALIEAYETDSWNYFKGDVYVGENVEGAEHRGFIVRYDKSLIGEKFEEKAFKTAQEAAQFYINYKNENQL